MTPDTRARAATYMRGFVGPVLYAPDVPETGFGNDFRAAMHQLASLPNDIEARAAIHAQTQHATSMLYGTPMASERPSSVMKLSVKPHSHTAIKAAMTDVGRLRAVISVERQELRKT